MKNLCKELTRLLTAALLVAAIPLTAVASPDTINYQGKLLDKNSGSPINDTVSMTFKIYIPGNAFVQWLSTRNVLVEDGIYQVQLGKNEPFGALDFSQSLELGITVESDAEMSPRQPLGSVAHAQQAFAADHATAASNADTLDSLDSTEFIQKGEAGTISTNMIVDGAITAADLGNNSVGSSQVADGSIKNSDLATSSVNSANIVDGTITAADLAADSVGASEIAAGAVVGGTGGDILDNSITAADLAVNSVGYDEIATAVVGASEIAAGAVIGGLAGDILDGSITRHDLAVDSVGSDELSEDIILGKTDNAGSISMRNSANSETISLDGSSGDIYASNQIKIGSAEYIADGGANLITTGSNSIETDGYAYTSAKTGYLFVPASAFRGIPNTNDYIQSDLVKAYVKGDAAPYSAVAIAPLYLPDDATVTRLDCYVGDESYTYYVDGYVRLYRKSYTSSAATNLGEVVLDTTAGTNSSIPILRTLTLVTPETVDTYSNQYSLYLSMYQATDPTWDANFHGCRIIFSITSLDP